MPLTAQDVYALQQQNNANRAAQGQQAQQQSQQQAQQYQQQVQQQAQQQYDWQAAQQQLAMQYAMWQYQQQQYKDQQDRSDKLSADYQKKVDQANQKNESRYLDILAGRTDTRNRVLNDLKDYGQNQLNNADERYKSLNSQMNADIYSRGFGGSPSMLNSAARSAEKARGLEYGNINNDIINRRTGADASQSEGLYGFMERRNDVPPDLNQLISLQQGLGRSGPYLPNPGMGNFGGGYGGPPQSFGGGVGQGGSYPFQLNPGMGGGNVNRNFRQGQAGAGPFPFQLNPGMGGMLANESIPGDMVAGGPVQQPVRSGFNQTGDKEAQYNRQRAMADYMQTYNDEGTNSLDHQARVRQQQQQMVLDGYGQWNPGQPMPLIPGMAGGPIGAGSLLPSLPYGGGGGYGGYGYRRGPQQQNQSGGTRQQWYPPMRTPRPMPVQPMAATTNFDWPVA